MMSLENSVEQSVWKRLKEMAEGTLFFNETFADVSNAKAVAKVLERLTLRNEIKRLAQGIYFKPEIDPVIGPVTPSINAVAAAIAERDKARIVPAGAYALNRLGLSTQMPMNLVYLTDGAARKVKIGKQNITFKKTAPKNVSAIGPISSLVIQALRFLGKDNLTKEEQEKVVTLLKMEQPNYLQHDMLLAPEWIRKIIRPVLYTLSHEPESSSRMVEFTGQHQA